MKAPQRTCNELGMCQSRKPACAGCTAHRASAFAFAPEVIEGYPKLHSPALRTWLLGWAFMSVLIALTCFVAGYLS